MAKTPTSSMRLGTIVPVLMLATAALAVAATCFSVDVAEYGLVTRFGRVVRVIVEPGFHITAPFDHVVRLDKRILFSRPARSEYLTADKKNVVVETLATWRIADPNASWLHSPPERQPNCASRMWFLPRLAR